MDTQWDIQLGSYGYCQILRIISQLLKPEHNETIVSFRASKMTKFIQLCSALILAKDSAIEKFPSQYFLNRMLQIRCFVKLSRFALHQNDFKDDIKNLFLEYIADHDERVRITAAKYIPVLLKLFPKHNRIYDVFMQRLETAMIPFEYEQYLLKTSYEGEVNEASMDIGESVNDCDDQYFTSTLIACAYMSQSPQLIKQSLFDILRACCCRLDLYQRKRKRNKQNRKLTKSTNFCYQSFQIRLLSFIGIWNHYDDVSQLCKDYFPWLMRNWIQGERTLRVHLFPFFLLINESWCLHTSSPVSFDDDYQQHMKHYRHVIIPLICQMTNSKLRWDLLMEVMSDLQIGTSDSSVAILLTETFSSIQATKFAWLFEERQDSYENNRLEPSRSEVINTLLDRSLGSGEIVRLMAASSNEIITSLLQSFTYFPVMALKIFEMTEELIEV
jgi:hypothetical protein